MRPAAFRKVAPRRAGAQDVKNPADRPPVVDPRNARGAGVRGCSPHVHDLHHGLRGAGGSTLRGGQTVFHGLRMWGQLFRAAMFFAAFTTVAVPAWTLWERTTGAEWYAAGMISLAEVKLVLGYDPDSGQEVRFEDGTHRVLRIRDEMFASAGLGAVSGAGLIGLFLIAFWYRGAQLGRQRCVLYDKMGSYTRAFFDGDRDVLMNPLEARNPRDFDMMAAALIPQQKDTVDPFWVTAARQLFSNGTGVLRHKGITENRVLVDHLLKTDLTALAEAMEGTGAQSIVDPDNPKTALSVRAMLTANLSALEFLPDTGKPFSIREWISDEERDGFLFLTSRGDQHASLRGLISTWLEIAVNAMLSLAQEPDRRIWVILDELPTLHQVPSLQPGLTESRQFGGCFVLGVQVASALRDLYGRNGVETISGLCGTRVMLAAPDRDTAQWSADSLGRSEVEEGFSYGANTIRDGVSLTPRRELRALALASEIMRLPNLESYLKFPGPFPVASIRLEYVSRPMAAERFVPREDGRGDSSDAAGLARLGYGIEKTHADGRFEIAGVSHEVVEAFSTRRAEIEAAGTPRTTSASPSARC